MVAVLMVVGLLALPSSIWAWRRNRRLHRSGMCPVPPRLWRWRWVIGAVLGIATFFLSYSVPADSSDDRYRIYGVPFMAYAFDQRGFDYVGLLTGPMIILNFITWLLLPQLLASLWQGVAQRRSCRAE